MFEGIFYPAEKEELSRMVSALLDRISSRAVASDFVLSPCASLDFAGELMALAIKSAALSKPERIFLISSAETHWEQNGPGIYLPESGSFMTPLWESMVDTQFVEILASSSTLIRRNDLPHLDTYRIEVQLPFIHKLCPHASIVPILVSGKSESLVKALAGGLRVGSMELPAKDATIIAGNISAFLPRKDATGEADLILALMEKAAWQDILSEPSLNSDSLNALALFTAMLGNRKARILGRQNITPGNDSHGDPVNSIEYAAVAGIL